MQKVNYLNVHVILFLLNSYTSQFILPNIKLRFKDETFHFYRFCDFFG